jgi:hypothetical protein
MRNVVSLIAVILFAVPLVAAAQERTAGGNAQQEASWSALTSLINKTDGDVKVLRIELNAMKDCNSKGMIYAPQTAGADGQGCKAVSAKPTLDYGKCQYFEWKGLYGLCPSNMVFAGGQTRNSDSGEWNGFYCCPFN